MLPSFMIASIEVYDRGASPAEISDMPEMLAERLAMPVDSSELGGYSASQLSIIRSVLDVVATRGDEAAAKSRAAIAHILTWFH